MTTIKLIKGRSYVGDVKATRENPFVSCDDDVADRAIASGFFVAVDQTETEQPEEPDNEPETNEPEDPVDQTETEQPGKPLDKMNKSELETFATYKNVSVKDAKTKAEIIEILKATLPAEELEGDIVYGSPTMTELQDK